MIGWNHLEENRLQKHEHEDRETSHHNADSQIKVVESNMTPISERWWSRVWLVTGFSIERPLKMTMIWKWEGGKWNRGDEKISRNNSCYHQKERRQNVRKQILLYPSMSVVPSAGSVCLSLHFKGFDTNRFFSTSITVLFYPCHHHVKDVWCLIVVHWWKSANVLIKDLWCQAIDARQAEQYGSCFEDSSK